MIVDLDLETLIIFVSSIIDNKVIDTLYIKFDENTNLKKTLSIEIYGIIMP